MKTEKEMQQGAQETQPLKEDELGKVSGGGPVDNLSPTEEIYFIRRDLDMFMV